MGNIARSCPGPSWQDSAGLLSGKIELEKNLWTHGHLAQVWMDLVLKEDD